MFAEQQFKQTLAAPPRYDVADFTCREFCISPTHPNFFCLCVDECNLVLFFAHLYQRFHVHACVGKLVRSHALDEVDISDVLLRPSFSTPSDLCIFM